MQSGYEDNLEDWYAIKLCVRSDRKVRFRHRINYQDWLQINVLRTWRRWRRLWHGVWKKLDKNPCIDQDGSVLNSRRLGKAGSPRSPWWSPPSAMCIIYIHWVPLTTKRSIKSTMLGFWVVLYEFTCKKPELFKSSSWHLYQDNALSHNSMLVADYLTEMDIKTITHPPYNPILPPATSGYLRS